MRFMQIESVLQTKNRSEPAKNWFFVALIMVIRSDHLGFCLFIPGSQPVTLWNIFYLILACLNKNSMEKLT